MGLLLTRLRQAELKALQCKSIVPFFARRDIVPLSHEAIPTQVSHGNPNSTARIHIAARRRGGCVAARGARAAASDARDRVSQRWNI